MELLTAATGTVFEAGDVLEAGDALCVMASESSRGAIVELFEGWKAPVGDVGEAAAAG